MTASGVITHSLDFISLSVEAGLNGVTQAADGTLYGTTHGSSQLPGTAFKISPAGTLTTLTTLTTLSNFPEVPPLGPLQAKPGGGFYGVTADGLSPVSSTLFTMTEAGAITTIASTDANSGALLPAKVVLGTDGNYYGALNSSLPGSIVKITPGGTISTLYPFPGDGTEGSSLTSLIAGADGVLYGTTYTGGTFQTLINFQGNATGSGPYGLVRTADGTLYGVTSLGDMNDSYGAVFKLSGGTLSFVHEFAQENGDFPSSLALGDDGTIYGLLLYGGAYQSGALFRIAANGDYQVLHHFDQASGSYPAQLSRGVDGNLYGTTSEGGAAHDGTVFRVRIDSSPTPFESWLTSNNLISGADGDDDHDGLSNLMEYATGTDPHVANAALAGEQSGTVFSDGGLVMRFTGDPATGPLSGIYARRKDYAASNLTYVAQRSADLEIWENITADPKVIASDDEVEIVSVDLLRYDSATVFYRLQVLVP